MTQRIALIGVPGSGKSELAEALAKELDSCQIVDNYVPEIEKETDIALGDMADYIGNLYVALGRYARERRAKMDHDTVITCGTLIETAVYSAFNIVGMQQTLPPEGKEEAIPRIDAMMRILACLYTDILHYEHVFYLPARDHSEETKFIDQQIQAALEGFKLIPVIPLQEIDTAARCELVLEALKKEVNDGSKVRS